MNFPFRTILLLFISLEACQPALAESCSPSILKTFSSSYSPAACVCGRELRNLTVTLPRSLTLIAVCAIHSVNNDPIDISKKRITLDSYDSLGNIPFGELLLRGEMTIKGVLAYEPGPAGEYWLTPKPRLIAEPSPMSAQLGQLKFDDNALEKLPVPRHFRESECFTANVTVKLIGIRLLIGETDEAGAYPVSYKVLRASGFKACSKK